MQTEKPVSPLFLVVLVFLEKSSKDEVEGECEVVKEKFSSEQRNNTVATGSLEPVVSVTCLHQSSLVVWTVIH